jgi:hypothetical protein
MRTNFEQMRHNLLSRAGIVPRDKAPHEGKSWEQIKAVECSDNFAEMMDNRLVMGFLRYGPIVKEKPAGYDLKRARDRLNDYEQTGNAEFLVDAANYCRLELRRGKHPTKHFHAVDRL